MIFSFPPIGITENIVQKCHLFLYILSTLQVTIKSLYQQPQVPTPHPAYQTVTIKLVCSFPASVFLLHIEKSIETLIIIYFYILYVNIFISCLSLLKIPHPNTAYLIYPSPYRWALKFFHLIKTGVMIILDSGAHKQQFFRPTHSCGLAGPQD